MRLFPKLLIAPALLIIFTTGTANAEGKSDFHYRLQVRIEPALHTLEAEAWIQHPPESRFYLYKGLSVRQVIADGKPVAFHADSAAARLPYAADAGAVAVDTQDVQLLDVKYGGEISQVVSGVNMITADLVELALYSAWFPMFQAMKWYSFELEATLPKGFVTTTNGLEKVQREQEGRGVTVWASYKPGDDIVLLASPHLQKLVREGEGIHIEMYYHRLPEQLLRSKMDGLLAGINRFSSLYGAPRVKGVLRLVYSPRSGWGYSRIPLIVVSEERAQQVLSLDNGEARDFRDNCHELAHFWWSVADPDTPDDWINEGLAEFTAFRFTEERYGEAFAEVRLAEYRQNATKSKTSNSIAETETASADREINRYDKATLMFLEAQRRFGKEPLDKLLKTFYTRFAGTGEATTTLFLEEVGKQMGKEAQAFFREELYRRPSVPSGTAESGN